MMEELEISPPKSTWIPPALKDCPFCGAKPYWLNVRRLYRDKAVPNFYHPGVVTDGECILSGRGYHIPDVESWNRRVPV